MAADLPAGELRNLVEEFQEFVNLRQPLWTLRATPTPPEVAAECNGDDAGLEYGDAGPKAGQGPLWRTRFQHPDTWEQIFPYEPLNEGDEIPQHTPPMKLPHDLRPADTFEAKDEMVRWMTALIMGSSQKEAQTFGKQLRKKVKENLRQLEVTAAKVESDKDIMATFGHIIIPHKEPPPISVQMPPLAPTMHIIRPLVSD